MNTHDPQRKLKVLLIEDDRLFQELATTMLAGQCVLLIAGSMEEADILLAQHGDIAILILDGYVPEKARYAKMGTTVALAERIVHSRGTEVVLFAASGDDALNKAFVQLGARPTNKSNAYTAVARYLCERKQQGGDE